MIQTMLKAVNKVEILTLQDNYIEMTALDGNAMISRAAPLKEGEIRASIVARSMVFLRWPKLQPTAKRILCCLTLVSLKMVRHKTRQLWASI